MLVAKGLVILLVLSQAIYKAVDVNKLVNNTLYTNLQFCYCC